MSRVYFIKPIGMAGPIKIGTSSWPELRKKSLATWSPFPLEVIADVPGGTELERRFHALFEEQHQRSEWFAWSQSMQDVIDSIITGNFDFDSLPAPKTVVFKNRVSPLKGRKVPLEHRYRNSASIRLDRAPNRHRWNREWCALMGNDWSAEQWFARREIIEAFIAKVGGNPSRKRWEA